MMRLLCPRHRGVRFVACSTSLAPSPAGAVSLLCSTLFRPEFALHLLEVPFAEPEAGEGGQLTGL